MLKFKDVDESETVFYDNKNRRLKSTTKWQGIFPFALDERRNGRCSRYDKNTFRFDVAYKIYDCQ